MDATLSRTLHGAMLTGAEECIGSRKQAVRFHHDVRRLGRSGEVWLSPDPKDEAEDPSRPPAEPLFHNTEPDLLPFSPSLEIASIFSELADRWEEDTSIESMLERMVLHPAYQQIIGLGRPAIPLILDRLQRSAGHWFWALVAITRQDVAYGEETVEGARKAWLVWGRQHGYINGAKRAESSSPVS